MVAKRDRLSKRKGVVPQSRREKRTMQPEDLQKRWEEQGEDIFAAVAQWRAAHPKATLAEIEQAGDRAHESAAREDDRASSPGQYRS